MATQPLNIILTNDDGYNAPGITTLYNALVAAGNTVRIVAPAVNQSAQGSSLGGLTAIASPIAITQFSPGNYFVDGRPATAALVAIDDFGRNLFGGAAPDLVISGTNRGENIGPSENISGTVNGALQGLFEGVPSIAVSAGAGANGSYDAAFANAGTFTADFVAKLQATRSAGAPILPAGEAVSINVPGASTLAGVAVTQVTPEASSFFPYSQQANGLYAEGFIVNTTPSGSTTSEGSQFILNRITVSPVDGEFGATPADRDALAVRLAGVNLAAAAPAHKSLNVLLLNEDGYGAAGITATRNALLAQGYNVTVLAPTTDQSGVGSALFLNPVTVTTYDAKSFAANATPASLVSLALDPAGLLRSMPKPDLVVAGADAGRAVGIENASHSATVAAAATALFNYGVPAIALTSASGSATDFATSADFLTKVIANLQATQGSAASILPAGIGLSINVPTGAAQTNFAFTNIDAATDANLSVAGNATQARFTFTGAVGSGGANSEGVAFNAGKITISPLDGSYAGTDATLYATLAALLDSQYGAPSAGFVVKTDAATGGHVIDLTIPAALTAAAGTTAIDTVVYDGFGSVTLPGTIENLALTNSGSAVGNALDNVITGVGGNAISAGAGADTVVSTGARNVLDGGQGDDTAVLDFKLADSSFTFVNGVTTLRTSAVSDQVRGFEHFEFSDVHVDRADGSPLVDDLFYLASYKDVLRSGSDPDTHFGAFGIREGRDPDALFSTKGYLAANPDVQAAGADPLRQFDEYGWKEGRDPSAKFDVELYLKNAPDVRAAGVDPLAHYLQFGEAEGRQVFAAIGKQGDVSRGFDKEFYLLSNPDVAAAGIDARTHFDLFGAKEGRNPDAFFDTAGYLAANPDVARSGINPLTHYDLFGFKEGRDPSRDFDTSSYLAANPDVAAAGVDPLQHYLLFGALEGRSSFADGFF